ncbi:MAG: extracellular solute-binding protein [Armatimonadetes bacterium]|nr:extracellular solute-binding protein [Armatimonadota bacterium]
MADRLLRVAFVSGERFAPLYELLPEFNAVANRLVEVVAEIPLSELLNRLLGPLAGEDVAASEEGPRPEAPCHLISGHSRYTADLAEQVLALDDWFSAGELAELDPAALEWCRWDGRLVQMPRCVETRLLYYRSDILEDRRERAWFRDASGGHELGVPARWEELAVVAQHFTRRGRMHGFVYPGGDTGLVALFVEILVSMGGRFLEPDGTPAYRTRAGEWTLNLMRDLFRRWEAVPPEMPELTDEDVSHLFRMGLAALACDYIGTERLLRDPTFSAVAGWCSVGPMPVGPGGTRAAWTGSPTFAIPADCPDPEGAVELLRFLARPEHQLREAKYGLLPVHLGARAEAREAGRSGTLAHRRFQLAEETLREAALVPPRFSGYREQEELLRRALLRGITSESTPDEALLATG